MWYTENSHPEDCPYPNPNANPKPNPGRNMMSMIGGMMCSNYSGICKSQMSR